jgi:hypothetical protein
MVIINPIEKKVSPLFSSFTIVNLSFADINRNLQLYGKEDGTIRFYIKNTGTVLLQELKVILNMTDSVPGITCGKNQTIKQIKLGDSTLVVIPIAADEKLKDGKVQFEIHVSDPAQLIIPTRAPVKTHLFTWVTPKATIDSVDFSVVKITGVLKTSSDITGLRVYINDQVPNDNKSFEVLATENLNEFRIERTVALNEGNNEIKIEARNDEGTTVSDSRTINYSIMQII